VRELGDQGVLRLGREILEDCVETDTGSLDRIDVIRTPGDSSKIIGKLLLDVPFRGAYAPPAHGIDRAHMLRLLARGLTSVLGQSSSSQSEKIRFR
jgi:hypothetical protein